MRVVLKIALYVVLIGPFFIWSQETIPDKDLLCSELQKMVKNDQLHRDKFPSKFRPNNKERSKKEMDSIINIQTKIDNYNTERLLTLTEKYGWLSNERLNCEDLNVFLIFRHSQSKYYNAISKVIEVEHSAKRLRTWEYEFIKDHIGNRPRG